MSHIANRPQNPSVRQFEPSKVREQANRLVQDFSIGITLAGEPLTLDFKRVQFLGSEDLGALVTLNQKVRAAGGRLSLVNVHPTVATVFSITRLDTLIEVTASSQL